MLFNDMVKVCLQQLFGMHIRIGTSIYNLRTMYKKLLSIETTTDLFSTAINFK